MVDEWLSNIMHNDECVLARLIALSIVHGACTFYVFMVLRSSIPQANSGTKFS